MSVTDLTVGTRLSLNQATVRRASLATAIAAALSTGIPAIGTWREPVADVGLDEACRLIAGSGLRVSSHCRGGFLTAIDGGERRRSIDDNLRAIDETAALTAAAAEGSRAALMLVVGGLPDGSRDIAGARARAVEGIAELVPHAQATGVMLTVEALHPMYAADRSVVASLRTAVDIAETFDAAVVGVAIDTFHVWWDADAPTQIARAGAAGRIASYQVCDWRVPLEADPLLSRHYPGEGVVDFDSLTSAVLDAGYDGDIEVEIFNQAVWDEDPEVVAARCVDAYARSVGVALARSVRASTPQVVA